MSGEPVKISEFQKNRNGAAIRVSLREFDGLAFLEIQEFKRATDGELAPTSKIVTLGVHLLANLAAAIEKAGRVARERGAA